MLYFVVFYLSIITLFLGEINLIDQFRERMKLFGEEVYEQWLEGNIFIILVH